MWLIKSPTGSIKYLCSKEKYTIGRKNTDIIISNDDSISRTHAIITIKDNKLYLEDNGSKYGTYRSDEKLNKNVATELHGHTEVKFGLLQSVYHFNNIKIKVSTSNIRSTEKSQLYKNIEHIHGDYITDWSDTCSHLTVSEVKLTVKVLCALTVGQPIVSVAFWDEVVKRVNNCGELPNPEDYMPEINESLLSKQVKLEYKPERQILFMGRTFVFLTLKTMNTMKDLIDVTGGKAILWETANISHNQLDNAIPMYLFIEENTQNINKETINYKLFYKAVEYIRSGGRRSIPLQEIALAVLYCSCEKDCNPDFDRVANLLETNTQKTCTSNILASETQNTQRSTQNINSQDMCLRSTIPDSLETNSLNFLTQNVDTASTLAIETLKITDSKVDDPKDEDDVVYVASTSVAVKRAADKAESEVAHKRLKKESVGSSTSLMSRLFEAASISICETRKKEQITSCSVLQKTSAHDSVIKKRKADSEIYTFSKKGPLENISNRNTDQTVPSKSDLVIKKNMSEYTSKRNEDWINSDTKEFLTSTIIKEADEKFCPDVSMPDIPMSGWLSKHKEELKKELDDDELREIDESKQNDEELLKWKESFRDKIIVEEMNLEVKRPKPFNDTTNTANKTLKNFKRFQKIQPVHIQTNIIPLTEYEIVVCGNKLFDIEDDFELLEVN